MHVCICKVDWRPFSVRKSEIGSRESACKGVGFALIHNVCTYPCVLHVCAHICPSAPRISLSHICPSARPISLSLSLSLYLSIFLCICVCVCMCGFSSLLRCFLCSGLFVSCVYLSSLMTVCVSMSVHTCVAVLWISLSFFCMPYSCACTCMAYSPCAVSSSISSESFTCISPRHIREHTQKNGSDVFFEVKEYFPQTQIEVVVGGWKYPALVSSMSCAHSHVMCACKMYACKMYAACMPQSILLCICVCIHVREYMCNTPQRSAPHRTCHIPHTCRVFLSSSALVLMCTSLVMSFSILRVCLHQRTTFAPASPCTSSKRVSSCRRSFSAPSLQLLYSACTIQRMLVKNHMHEYLRPCIYVPHSRAAVNVGVHAVNISGLCGS
jgi:hypothetical protein